MVFKMKTTFLINNRQSGKSKIALYEFLKDPSNTMLIFHNMEIFKNYSILKNYKDNLFTQNSEFADIRFKRCVIDEYLFFDTKNIKKLYEILPSFGIEELIITTSSNKLYDSNLFYFIKYCKRTNKTNYIEEFFNNVENNDIDKDAIIKNLNELYVNFLTDENTNIINNIDLFNKTMFAEDKFYIRNSERYATEIEGKFLK